MPTVAADGLYWIDLSADPLFSGGSFVSTYPEGLTFDDEIRQVGNASWQYSFSALDQDGNTVVNANDFIGPYRDYYRLRYGNVVIQAGPIVSTKTKLGDDFMSVAGKTWEHIPERWEYPFDGRTIPVDVADHLADYSFVKSFIGNELVPSGAVTPVSLVMQASNRDVIRIFGDIFSNAMNLVGNRFIFDLSNLTGLAGITSNFQFSWGDNSKIFQFISDLAGIGDGFDWWVGPVGAVIFWASPYRYGNPSAPSIVYTFDNSVPPPNSLEFTNNGPVATHVQGRGAGLATSTTLSRAFDYNPSQALYTRMDESYDFGDVRNVPELIAKTKKQFSYDLNPQHEITMQVDPGIIANYWSTFRKGRAVYIDQQLVAHHIQSAQQLYKYTASVTPNGECLVDWTLKQVYNTSSTVGVPGG